MSGEWRQSGSNSGAISRFSILPYQNFTMIAIVFTH
jgi:hypothetical protein